MSTVKAPKAAVTNCRLCGQPFPHRMLASFEGIKVWERRYCIRCGEARVREENERDAKRAAARAGLPKDEP